MTMSAFGVEHADISKARGDRGARKAAQAAALSAQQQAALHSATGRRDLAAVERYAQRFHEAQAAHHTPKVLTALRHVVGKRDYDAAERRALEAKGDARPGGRFPIANAEDVEHAERLWSKAKPADRAFIRRRAAQLGVSLKDTAFAGSGKHGAGDARGRKMFAEQRAIGKSAFGVDDSRIAKADGRRANTAAGVAGVGAIGAGAVSVRARRRSRQADVAAADSRYRARGFDARNVAYSEAAEDAARMGQPSHVASYATRAKWEAAAAERLRDRSERLGRASRRFTAHSRLAGAAAAGLGALATGSALAASHRKAPDDGRG